MYYFYEDTYEDNNSRDLSTDDTVYYDQIFDRSSKKKINDLSEQEDPIYFQNYSISNKKRGRLSHSTTYFVKTPKTHTRETKDNIIRKIKIAYLHLFLIPFFNALIKSHFHFQKIKLCKLSKDFVNISSKDGIKHFGKLLVHEILSTKITTKCFRKNPEHNNISINKYLNVYPFNTILQLSNDICFKKMFLGGNIKINDDINIDDNKILTFAKWKEKIKKEGATLSYLKEIDKIAVNFFEDE